MTVTLWTRLVTEAVQLSWPDDQLAEFSFMLTHSLWLPCDNKVHVRKQHSLMHIVHTTVGYYC